MSRSIKFRVHYQPQAEAAMTAFNGTHVNISYFHDFDMINLSGVARVAVDGDRFVVDIPAAKFESHGTMVNFEPDIYISIDGKLKMLCDPCEDFYIR